MMNVDERCSTFSLVLLLLQTFTEGITNQLLGCFVGSLQDPGCVLVRLYGRMTELFVNRDREVEMFQVLHSHGCGPQIYCSFQNGICYEFVRGTVLDDELLRQPSIYRSVLPEQLSHLSVWFVDVRSVCGRCLLSGETFWFESPLEIEEHQTGNSHEM